MNKILIFLTCLALSILFTPFASAQITEEKGSTCNDGVDNDGDGTIDCADGDCQFDPATIEKGCNCNDGADNDGDGKTDTADPDCAGFYGFSFIGEGSDCSVTPPFSGDGFNILTNPTVSGQNTVDTQSKMAIGDVDNDGIPDVIATSKWNQTIRVIATTENQPDDSDAGDIKSSWRTPGAKNMPSGSWFLELEVAIADIDKDGIGEMFTIASKRANANGTPQQYALIGFTYEKKDLVPLWDAIIVGPDRPGIFGLADFDGDGLAEVYMRNRIYAAETGELLADVGGNWDTEINAAPVAVNINKGSANLELVVGENIYNVPNLVRDGNSATLNTLTLWKNMNSIIPSAGNKYFPKTYVDVKEYGTDNFSSTSVADFNGDGQIDVFISGARGSNNGITTVYYWDVANETVDIFIPVDPADPLGWPWGTGRINLGEADGDGKLEATFIAGNQLYVLDDNGPDKVQLKYQKTINDSRSGVVAVTIYDFDNDGAPEIVYRDAGELGIIDGETGADEWAVECRSHTMTEGPIIADVNGDGDTDICVPCFRGPGGFDILDGVQQQALGEIRLFYSSNDSWLPTREVWNQSGYFVINILDDLTLPLRQMDMDVVFSEGPCDNGIPGPIRPFNTYLNQVPTLGPSGCPIFPGPDITFNGDNVLDPDADPSDSTFNSAVNVIPPICGDLGIKAFFNIINNGELPISTTIPISFWDGNPTLAVDSTTGVPATLLHTYDLLLDNLEIGDSLVSDTTVFNSTGRAFRLWIVLNNDGDPANFPVPYNDPSNPDFVECSIDNNFYYIDIIPDPFTVQIQKNSENVNCDPSGSSNGELQALVLEDGIETTDYSKYGFQWYYGNTLSNPIPAGNGGNDIVLDSIFGDTDGELYSLVVTNLDKGCASIIVTDTVFGVQQIPPVTSTIKHQEICSPPDGEIHLQLLGGSAGYTFSYIDPSGSPMIGITGPSATNLTEGEYRITITSPDGCAELLQLDLLGPTEPDVVGDTITHIVNCEDLNSGKITATAYKAGVEKDSTKYTFEWYYYDTATLMPGSLLPPVHGTGPTRYGLTAGYYAVLAIDDSTQCSSVIPSVVEIKDKRTYPGIQISEVQPQRSCDPSTPNGILRAEVIDSLGNILDPAGYIFEWFKGDNTLPSNAHTSTSGVNGSVAENVMGGGIYYTVRVTNENECAQTTNFIISSEIINPVVTLDSLPNSICDPALASSNFNGQVIASVTYNGTTVTLPDPNYVFTWYEGSTTGGAVITPTDGNNPILSELDGGYYTVVATRVDYQCESVPVTTEVTEQQVLPTINISKRNMTTCTGTPNGRANASVAGIGTNGYSFKWFIGTDTLGAQVANIGGAAGNVALNLDGSAGSNTYTVLVINNTTGCSNTRTINIADVSVLPVVSLTSDPNSTCDPAFADYTGVIYTSVSDTRGFLPKMMSQYSYTWVDSLGNDATTISGATVTQDSILQNIPSGNYTVVVSNDSLGCISDPVNVFVDSTKVLPNIVIDPLNPMTACDTTMANGDATALIDVGGSLTAAGYSFEWYRGMSASGTLLSNTNFIDGLNGFNTKNNYIVKAVNQATGCESTEIIAVPDAAVKPTTVPTSTPNSICDPSLTNPAVQYNGTITVPVTDPNAVAGDSYEYELFLAGVSQATQTDNNVFTGLADATYTVTVTNLTLGCTSDPVTIVVDDTQVLPTIDLTITPMTTCDGTTPNGAASAEVGGVTAGYSFEWFTGSDVTIAANSIGTNPTVSNLDGTTGSNTYTVLVTNLSSGCQNTESFNVADNSILPTTVPTSTPNSICDPSLTNPAVQYNGTITVPVTDPNAVAGDSYEYELFLAGVSQATQTDNNVFTGLADATYTVTVTNLTLGCTSDPVTIVVDDTQVLPTIDLTITPMTTCDGTTPNGAASAEVGGVTAGYSFEWFTGSDVTIAANSIGTNPTVSNLDGTTGSNTYTVLVTNLSSGCQNTESFNVADNSILPTTVPTSTPNSICDPSLTNPAVQYNGTITVPVTDPNAVAGDSYEYELFLAGVSQATQTDNNVFTGLADATYTVTVTNLTLGCTSDPVTIVVDDTQVLPTIDLTITPMTTCDGTTPNGAASAEVGGVTAGYSFEWFTGSDVTIAANSIGTNPTVSNLDGTTGSNTYTVLVTNLSSGCQNTESFNVADNSILPTTVPTSTPNSICDPSLTNPAVQYNGTITVPVTDPNAVAGDSYEYELFLAGVSQATQTDNNVFTGLADATYTVTVTNLTLGCTSDPVTIVVDDTQVLPTIDLTITPMTTCDGTTPNGAASAEVGGVTAGYSFEWFTGSDVTIATNSIGTNPTVSNLDGTTGSNTYTVLVTNLSSGCQNTESFNVADNSILPTTVPTSTPNSICDPSLTNPAVQYNGTITVPVTDPNAVAGDSYEYELFLAGVSQATQTDNNVFTGLVDATYTVTVTNLTLGCTSDPVTIVVDDTQVLPTIDLTITPMTTCDGTTPNGAASAEVGGVTAGYSFEWFTGTDVTILANRISTTATAAGLDGSTGSNTYIVLVTNLSSGCQSTESFNVPDNSELPTFTLESDPNEVCDPALASADFTGEVRVVNLLDDNNPGGHTYTYTFTNIGTTAVVTQATPTLSNLEDGDYRVTVTNDVLGCTSDPVEITVDFDPTLPAIVEALTPSTNCTAADNGSLTITTIDGVAPTGDYTIHWYIGNIVKFDGGGARTPDFTGTTYSGVPGGVNYTVEVINEITGCINTESYTLPDNSALPTFTLEADPNEVCDDALASADFTGEVRVVNFVDVNGAGHTYTYTFTNIGTTDVVTQPTGTLSNLPQGNYRVTVTNNNLGCTSDPDEITIDFTPTIPTIAETVTPSTNCTTADNGQIVINLIDGAVPTADYTINWYDGNAVVFDGAGDRDPVISGVAYSGLPGGANYTVEVINNITGCSFVKSYTLADQSALPVVTLTKTADNTICDPSIGFNGAVTASVTYKGAVVPLPDPNYVFTWYDGNNTSAPVITVGDNTAAVLAALEGGFYTVRVTNVALGCTSNPATREVKDIQYTPVINIAVTPQTSCVGESGELLVTIDETAIGNGTGGDPLDYNFTWFEYDNVANTTSSLAVGTVGGTNNEHVTELPSGYYKVTVERISTGCTQEKTVFVPETITVPTVSIIKNSDLTNCGTADGSLTASVGGVEAGYTFYWYDSDDAADEDYVIANADFTSDGDGNYPGLTPGFYTVVAVHNTTGCISPMDVEEIENVSNAITIAIDIDTYPNTCGLSDGVLIANPSVATEVTDPDTDFTYAWYEGGPINTEPIDFFTNPPVFNNNTPIANTRSLTNQTEGTYTIVVTYATGSGCSEYRTYYLPFQDAPVISTVITNSTICPSTIGNGEIEMTIDPSAVTAGAPLGDPSLAIDNDNFTLYFYSGANSNVLISGPIELDPPTYGPNDPITVGTGLAPGFYTLVLYEDYTGGVCPITTVVEVKQDVKPPVVTGSVTAENTACDMSAADGQISINVSKATADPVVATYDLNISPDPGSQSSTGNAAGAYTFNNLPAGPYTVTVTASTGCSSVRNFTVGDNPTVAEVVGGNYTVNPAHLCLPSGNAEITDLTLVEGGASEDMSDYEFTWYSDAALTAVVSGPVAGDLVAGQGGDYLDLEVENIEEGIFYAVAKKITNTNGTGGVGCTSAPFQIEIEDVSEDPVAVLVGRNNTACDGSFEGSVEIEVTDTYSAGIPFAPDFDITLTGNTSTTAAAQTISSSAGTGTFSSLEEDTYTATVVNNSTGCTTSETVTIVKNTQPLIINTVVNTPQTYCDPNGTVEVTEIILQGVDVAPKDGFDDTDDLINYTFLWYEDASLTNPIADTDALIENREAGNYFVVAKKTSGSSPGSGCESLPYEEIIDDNTVDPVLALKGFANTACDGNFEGSIEIDVADPAGSPGAGELYTYDVDGPKGTNENDINQDGVDDVYTGLEDDTYTVIATNELTKCFATKVVTIQKNAQPIIVNQVTHVDQTICGPNGEVEVTDIILQGIDRDPADGTDDSDDLANYTFTWYNNAALSPAIPGETDSLLQNISAGSYYVVAKKIGGTSPGSGCESAPFKEDVKNISVKPVIALKGFANTACDGNFEGSFEIDVADPSGPGAVPGTLFTYNISGTKGFADNTPGNDGIDDAYLGREDDTYTVIAINETTNCQVTGTVTIQKNAQPIIVNQVTHENQTICGPNGEVEVIEIILQGIDVDNSGSDDIDLLTNYTFEWYNNAALTAPLANTDELLENVGVGSYYVIAKKIGGVSPGSGCESAPYREDVGDDSVNPIIALTGFSNTACDNNFEGSFEIDVADTSGDGVGALYTYDVTGTKGFTDNANSGNDGIDDLYPGMQDDTYTVVATNEITSCETTGTVTIQKNAQPIIVNQVTHVDQTICGPNGEVEVIDIILQGIDTNGDDIDDSDLLTNYTFSWYEDAAQTVQIADTDELIEGIGAGDYYVVAHKIAGTSPGSGCQSAPYREDVEDVSINPVIALTGFSNTACDNNFEGSFEIDVADPSGPGAVAGALFTYDVSGTKGFTDNANSGNDGINDLYPGMQDDTYTVVATNEITNCETSGTVTIQKNAQPIIVNQVTHINQTICGPNGEVEVIDIILQGIDTNGDDIDDSDLLTNYTFSWYEDAAQTVQIADTDELIQGVGAGDYYVVAHKIAGTSPGSGCESAPYREDVEDDSVNPIIALTGFSNTACDNNFEGSIEIDVADPSGPGLGALFTYDFTGPTAIPTANNETGIDDTRENLADGQYTVLATNETTNCTTTGTVTIQKNQQPIFVTNFNITDQDFCTPNGDVEVSEIILQGIDADDDGADDQDDLTNYTFEWYTDAQLTDQLADTDIDINDIGAGDYYVVATKVTGSPGSGCSTPPLRADVDDISVDPIISLTGFSNTACDNNFEGAIEINVADPSGPGVGEQFSYTFTGPTAIPAAINETGVADRREDLADGAYTVTATNELTSCVTTGTVTIQKNQQPIFVTTLDIKDQDFCSPNGEVEVAQIILQGYDGDSDGNDDADLLGNYSFTWYNDNALTDQRPETSVNVAGLAAGDYYVIAKKESGEPGSGCESAPVRADIKDISIDPVVNLTSTDNTACDITAADGSILATVTDAGANPTTYTYDWLTTTSNTLPTDSLSIDASAGWNDLEPGIYEIQVVSDGTSCFTTGTITVLNSPSIPEVMDSDIAVIDQTLCDPSGSIDVLNLDPGDVSDYTFEWRKGTDFGSANVVGDNQSFINNTTYLDIRAGSYWFQATKNAGSSGEGDGCNAPPVRVEIDDVSEGPILAITNTANTACDNNFDGSITLNLTEVAGTPGVGGNYKVIWTSSPDTAVVNNVDPVNSPYTTVSPDVIAPGAYTMNIENNATGCMTNGTVTILHSPQTVDIVTVDKEDPDICFPDGRITVTATNPTSVPQYSYSWYREKIVTGDELVDGDDNVITANEITNANYTNMGAGTYHIIATRIPGTGAGSGCPSAPFRVDLEDLSVDPNASLEATSNTACDPLLSNANIEAVAFERDGTTNTYTYTWTVNGNAITDFPQIIQTDNSPTSELSNAIDGDYTISVFNTVTGCVIDKSIKVTIDSLASEPNIIDVLVTLPTDCNFSGSAEVTKLLIGGVPPPITDPAILASNYTYGWYRGDYNANALIQGESGSIINDTLATGNYFVDVLSLATGCVSEPKEFIVADTAIIYPHIDMSQTIPQINCEGPPFGAELRATATETDGTVGPQYTFNWYYDTLGTNNYEDLPAYVVSSNPENPTVVGNVGIANTLPVGIYKVIAQNTTTSCIDSAFYVVVDESEKFTPQVRTGSEPLTYCYYDNGVVYGQTIAIANYPYAENYTFNWFIGPNPDVNVSPDYPNTARVEGLPDGVYTLKVKDENTLCITTKTVTVTDERLYPDIRVLIDNPVTNCYDSLPNGQLTTEVIGAARLSDYRFRWFNAIDTLSNFYSNNFRISSLREGPYTVSVRRELTGCTSVAGADIIFDPNEVPVPTPSLLAAQTSCLDPNGQLQVTVGGKTVGYIFDWYESGSGSSFADDLVLKDLNSGDYDVTTTEIKTGCTSDRVMINLPEDLAYPEFELRINPSACEFATGSVEIDITNRIDVNVNSIEWYEGNISGPSAGFGGGIYDVFAGPYHVLVRTNLGCETGRDFEVHTEVLDFNLVAPNGNPDNAYFHVDCISNFPDNIVSIYNRNGVKVYEAEGYNNTTVKFTGVGESGAYLMGNTLPDGTYFYVIDKRDGSKPIAGYLELIR